MYLLTYISLTDISDDDDYRASAGLMLGQPRRRSININPALVQLDQDHSMRSLCFTGSSSK